MSEPNVNRGDDDFVWILGLATEDEEGSGDRGRLFRTDEARFGRGRVPAQLLQQNVEVFIHSMGRALKGVPTALSGYSIDSIDISAEISATGSVSLLGNGGELSGKGGICFKLTRQKGESANSDAPPSPGIN